MRLLLYLITSLTTLTNATPFLHPRQDGQKCNGQAAFCSRKYSNVTLIGAHDSPFVGPIADPRVNQEKSVADQLAAGVRFLTGQTHLGDVVSNTVRKVGDAIEEGADDLGNAVREGGEEAVDAIADLFRRAQMEHAIKATMPLEERADQELHLCHTSCALLDSGPLRDFLNTVKTFLDGNADEVVTLLLTNGDNVDISSFSSVFEGISGLTDYAFVPSTSPNKLEMDAWPTYGELISSGKRLVVFLDSGADQTKVNYILDEFTYFFETPYDTTDPTFNQCTIDRPANTASADGRMYIVNHFLDKELIPGNTAILIPDNDADFTTNAATGNGSIGAQSDLCTAQHGRVPNVVLVDMFDRGDVFTAQNNLNSL